MRSKPNELRKMYEEIVPTDLLSSRRTLRYARAYSGTIIGFVVESTVQPVAFKFRQIRPRAIPLPSIHTKSDDQIPVLWTRLSCYAHSVPTSTSPYTFRRNFVLTGRCCPDTVRDRRTPTSHALVSDSPISNNPFMVQIIIEEDV